MLPPPPIFSSPRTQLVHLPRGAPATHSYTDSPTPSPTSAPVGAFPESGPCNTSLPRSTHSASDRLLPAHLVGASPGRGHCHASLPRHAYTASGFLTTDLVGASPGMGPRNFRPSPTGTSKWCFSRDEPLPRLPTSTCPRRLRVLSTHPGGISPRRFPSLSSLHQQAYAASGILQPAQPVGASPGRGPCHVSLHRRAKTNSRGALPAHLVRASPGRGPCHASLHRYVDAASGLLLSAQTLGSSLRRCLATPIYIGMPTPPPVLSYRRN